MQPQVTALASLPSLTPLLSLLLQTDVEAFFTTNMGFMLAGYHEVYWMGLRASIWPEFNWVDMSTNLADYDHW